MIPFGLAFYDLLMAAEIMGVPDRYRRYDAEEPIDACPNCGQSSRLRRHDRRVVWPKITHNLAPLFDPYAMEEVWECLLCKKSMIIVRTFEAGENQEREPVAASILYPVLPPKTLQDEAPAAVTSLYREASVAENAGALRGAAALYRAAVEQLLTDLGIPDGKLGRRIEQLADRGVDVDVVTSFHEARLLGNWSLHDGVEFSPEEVSDVAELIVEATEELYVIPAKREEMRAARAARRTKDTPSTSG